MILSWAFKKDDFLFFILFFIMGLIILWISLKSILIEEKDLIWLSNLKLEFRGLEKKEKLTFEINKFWDKKSLLVFGHIELILLNGI